MNRLYHIDNSFNPSNRTVVDLSKILMVNQIDPGGRHSPATFPITLAGTQDSRHVHRGGWCSLEDHRAMLVAAWNTWTQYVDALERLDTVGPVENPDEPPTVATMEIGSEAGDVFTVAIRDILHVTRLYEIDREHVYGIMVKRAGEVGVVKCSYIGKSSAERFRQLVLDTVARHRPGEIA